MHCPRDGLHLVAESEHAKDPRDTFLGATIGGRYPILEILGSGGMGTVYGSVQPLVDRQVAIKVVHSFKGRAAEQSSRRFLREAKAIASMSHPAIVTLFDFGVDTDGTAYMVMERLAGETLRDGLERGGLTRRGFVGICLEMLDALDAAHGRGLIHRDLKPENVILLRDPTQHHHIKILDFGLAKLIGDSTMASQLTREGMVFGTPAYMAPEQVMGTAVDARADLYAVAAMLFEGLVGRLPYDDTQPVRVLQAHLTEPVPVLPPTQPPGMRAVVLRAMAKERDDRYETAAGMAAALRVAAGELPADDDAVLQSAPAVLLSTAPDGHGDTLDAVDEPAGDGLQERATQVRAAGRVSGEALDAETSVRRSQAAQPGVYDATCTRRSDWFVLSQGEPASGLAEGTCTSEDLAARLRQGGTAPEEKTSTDTRAVQELSTPLRHAPTVGIERTTTNTGAVSDIASVEEGHGGGDRTSTDTRAVSDLEAGEEAPEGTDRTSTDTRAVSDLDPAGGEAAKRLDAPTVAMRPLQTGPGAPHLDKTTSDLISPAELRRHAADLSETRPRPSSGLGGGVLRPPAPKPPPVPEEGLATEKMPPLEAAPQPAQEPRHPSPAPAAPPRPEPGSQAPPPPPPPVGGSPTQPSAAAAAAAAITAPTMEGADGAEAPATGRSGGRRWLLVVAGAAAAAVMVLGVVLALALGGGGSGPAPAQVAAGGKAGKTRVHISSDPTGARVLWAGDLIGVTPVKIEPPGKRGSKVVYRIEKAGRRPARLQVVLDGKEQEHSVRLRLAKGE